MVRVDDSEEKRKEIKKTVNELLSLVQLEEHGKNILRNFQAAALARGYCPDFSYDPEVSYSMNRRRAGRANPLTSVARSARYSEVNVPAVFITHDQEEALELGDRIAVINAGNIEQIGTPAEVYNNPATEYVATFLGAANILEGNSS